VETAVQLSTDPLLHSTCSTSSLIPLLYVRHRHVARDTSPGTRRNGKRGRSRFAALGAAASAATSAGQAVSHMALAAHGPCRTWSLASPHTSPLAATSQNIGPAKTSVRPKRHSSQSLVECSSTRCLVQIAEGWPSWRQSCLAYLSRRQDRGRYVLVAGSALARVPAISFEARGAGWWVWRCNRSGPFDFGAIHRRLRRLI